MADWYEETFDNRTRLGLRYTSMLFDKRSPFQHIQVIDSVAFGRVLIIDGVFMTSEGDEFLYHELLVHPALTSAPSVDRVLVIGGGDGGTVREVLRHDDVKACVMIEIDEMVVETSKRLLPKIGGAWNDPRLDVRFIDGARYVRDSDDPPYDVIVLDGTDPVGPGAALFDGEFYNGCKRMLKPAGVLALQSASPLLMLDVFLATQRKLNAVFENVRPYIGPVPLYGTGTWSWTWCSNGGDPLSVNQHRQAAIAQGCKAYNPEVHRAAFALPNYLVDALERQSGG